MRRLNPTQLILLSFATIIFVGTVALLLPAAANGPRLSLLEALFTATSATCVTGLTLIDIGTRLTLFGQLVVLGLIQIGGLGIMTFSTFFMYMFSRKMTIRGREMLQQTLSQKPMKEIGSLLKTVFLVTIFIEGIGVCFYWSQFIKEFPVARAAYLAIFHSISAFCNAGFSLFSTSLIDFQGNVVLNITTVILIVIGGLGFVVIFDLFRALKDKKRKRPFKIALHTRIVLYTTGWLIFTGFLLFLVFDFTNQLKPLSVSNKLLAALFQSVTCRTAGFNTVDIGQVTNASLLLFIILMFIGASPASCGGGIKTSTFTVLLAMILARFRNEQDVNLMRRRVNQDDVSKAIAVTFFSGGMIGLFTLLMVFVEEIGVSHLSASGGFLEILFEVVSAYGTVGLSTGITPSITNFSKILLIILMYVGRLGPLTIALGVAGEKKRPPYRYAEENVLIG